jgi:hypothetical protein
MACPSLAMLCCVVKKKQKGHNGRTPTALARTKSGVTGTQKTFVEQENEAFKFFVISNRSAS